MTGKAQNRQVSTTPVGVVDGDSIHEFVPTKQRGAKAARSGRQDLCENHDATKKKSRDAFGE